MRRGSARLVVGDLPQQFAAVGRVERGLERQQLVERGAQRIDVGAMVEHHARAERLLGAHVAERAQQVAGHRQVRPGFDAGQAEVGEPQAAALVDQQIRGLDVAMHDAAGVGVFQCLGRLHGQLGRGAKKGGAATDCVAWTAPPGPCRRLVEVSRLQGCWLGWLPRPAGGRPGFMVRR